MFVKPALLIASASKSASVVAPVAVNDTVTAVANASAFLTLSARSNVFEPAVNVEAVISADVITVLPVAALRHNLNVAVDGVASNPLCSFAFD